MGIIGDAKDFVDGIDFDEPHADRGYGFDTSVCAGCEHHDTDGLTDTCTLCGCPTGERSPMSLLGMPPVECPRLESHEG